MKRLAVIGTGLIGQEHCKLIADHPGTTLAGIADPSETAFVVSQEHAAPMFDNYPQLLDSLALDGVIVAAPTGLHAEIGRACLEKGLPCLIEKPVADGMDAGRAVAEASEALGVPVLVGHHRRHSPDMRAARRVIADGAIGEVMAVNGLWLMAKPDSYFEASWRRETGGGPILINLIHEIDCLRHIVGEIEAVSAFAAAKARGHAVEETVSLSLRFEGGALGTFLLSDAVPSPYSWEITSGQALYFPHRPGDCCVIGGRTGTLSLPSMTLWRHEEPGGSWQDAIHPQILEREDSRTYRNQLDHFLDVIDGAAPLISARDGLKTLAATLAVARSAEEGRTVSVAEVLG